MLLKCYKDLKLNNINFGVKKVQPVESRIELTQRIKGPINRLLFLHQWLVKGCKDFLSSKRIAFLVEGAPFSIKDIAFSVKAWLNPQ